MEIYAFGRFRRCSGVIWARSHVNVLPLAMSSPDQCSRYRRGDEDDDADMRTLWKCFLHCEAGCAMKNDDDGRSDSSCQQLPCQIHEPQKF